LICDCFSPSSSHKHDTTIEIHQLHEPEKFRKRLRRVSRASLRRTSCATRVVAKSLIVALSAEWEGSLMRQEALKDRAIEIVDDIAIGF